MSALSSPVAARSDTELSAGPVFAVAVLVSLVCTAGATLSLTRWSGDYMIGRPVLADNAAPGVHALAHLQIARAAALQPMMGLLSLLLRAPAVAVAEALGSGSMTIYRVGAFACLLPCALFAAWVATRDRRSLITVACGLLGVALLMAGPVTANALREGHPEEILTAVLATTAVLAAQHDRSRSSGVLLGLAIGCKPWAVIAVPSVVFGLQTRHRSALLLAAGVGGVLAGTLPLMNTTAFHAADHVLSRDRTAGVFSLWWPASAAQHVGANLLALQLNKSEALLGGLSVATAAICRLGYGLRRAGRHPDPLAMLCLLALARCIIDPGPMEYYYTALVVPLVKTVRRGRVSGW